MSMSNKNDKKIVGIRTDITFEISDDEKNSTTTKTKNKETESIDEDDIVPVFKGYGNGQDPKSYDDNRRWDMINIPVFHGTDDEPRRTGGGGGDWVRFVPITTVWTTERNNYLSNRGRKHYRLCYSATLCMRRMMRNKVLRDHPVSLPYSIVKLK